MTVRDELIELSNKCSNLQDTNRKLQATVEHLQNEVRYLNEVIEDLGVDLALTEAYKGPTMVNTGTGEWIAIHPHERGYKNFE